MISAPHYLPGWTRNWRRGWYAVIILGVLLGMLGVTESSAAAAQEQVADPQGIQGAMTPEQQLAEKYAPIVYVKQQAHPCDRNGEAYLPAPVEVVFNDPDVALVEVSGRVRSGQEPIAMAPGVADLPPGEEYHLDFPGNPRSPGCDYERWFQSRWPGNEPVTYANVVDGEGRVAVQYWFWYVFNDFNNTHEGDWEMVQILFNAESAAEALTKDPAEVGYSQHAGGERAGWEDEKLQKEGSQPVVWAAAGSHASNFGSAVYLGWGEDNAGFGCDVTTGPSNRVEPRVILLPHDISEATGPLAWLTWEGRWGERQRAFYNGPGGPGPRERWLDPFTWQDETPRDSSIVIPSGLNFGPGPTSVFCRTTELVSLALTRVVVYPGLVLLVIMAMVGVGMGIARFGGSTLTAAWRLYRSRWHTFALLGLMLIPIGLLATVLQSVLIEFPPGEQIAIAFNRGPGAQLAVMLTIGGLQQAVNLLVIGPSVILAVGEIRAGRTPSFIGTYREVFRRLKQLALAVATSLVIVSVLALSVVGIPWAIARAVQWLFVSQAVLLHGAGWREALRTSERAVASQWWRTAATSLLLAIVGSGLAPALGIFFLVVASPAIRYVNWLSSFLYAILVPLSVIGLTLLYLDLRSEQVKPVERGNTALESDEVAASIATT